MVDRVGEVVTGPLGKKDRHNDQEQELDVVRDLNHDHGKGHGEPGDSTEEGDPAKKRKGARIHPLPVRSILQSKRVHSGPAQDPSIQAAHK